MNFQFMIFWHQSWSKKLLWGFWRWCSIWCYRYCSFLDYAELSVGAPLGVLKDVHSRFCWNLMIRLCNISKNIWLPADYIPSFSYNLRRYEWLVLYKRNWESCLFDRWADSFLYERKVDNDYSMTSRWIWIVLVLGSKTGQVFFIGFPITSMLARIFRETTYFRIDAIWPWLLLHGSRDVFSYFWSRLFVHIERIWPI